MEACRNCGRSNASRCAGCKQVSYCSKECQREDWYKEHKEECRKCPAKKEELYPHTIECTIENRNGFKIKCNPINSLYLIQSRRIRIGLPGHLYLSGEDFDQDPISSQSIYFNREKVGEAGGPTDTVVDVFGKVTNTRQAAHTDEAEYINQGVYVTKRDTNERESKIKYDYDNRFFLVNTSTGLVEVPFERAYIAIDTPNYSEFRPFYAYFQRYDLFLRDLEKEKFLDFANNEDILDLKVDVDRINSSLFKTYNTLREETQKKREDFVSLPLISQAIITNEREDFTVYPPTFQLAYSFERSLFSTTTLTRRNTIKLDNDMEVLLLFFKLLLRDKLPTLDFYLPLLNQDIFTQMLEIADFLGLEFYVEYFQKLTRTNSYRKLIA